MWALRLTDARTFETLDLEPPAASDLTEGEVLLRSLAGGICGSDIPKFVGAPRSALRTPDRSPVGAPGVPLHEVVGEVVHTRHQGFEVGEHVVGWVTGSDGLAEYVVTEGEQVVRHDPGLDPLQAVLVQPLACVLYALRRVDVRGRHVAVLGLGPIGCLFAHVAAVRGARRVTGVDPVDRSATALSLGFDAHRSTSREWLSGLADPDRPDVVVEAVGHQQETLRDAVEAAAVGGTVLAFGIPDSPVYPVDVETLMRRNLALIGIVARDRRTVLGEADEHLREYPALVDTLLTHAFGWEQAAEAFEVAAEPAVGRLKVVLDLTRGRVQT